MLRIHSDYSISLDCWCYWHCFVNPRSFRDRIGIRVTATGRSDIALYINWQDQSGHKGIDGVNLEITRAMIFRQRV